MDVTKMSVNWNGTTQQCNSVQNKLRKVKKKKFNKMLEK
jgi:hypothetical protein